MKGFLPVPLLLLVSCGPAQMATDAQSTSGDAAATADVSVSVDSAVGDAGTLDNSGSAPDSVAPDQTVDTDLGAAMDSAIPDAAGDTDLARPDAAVGDSGYITDAAVPDAAVHDAAVPDAVVPDAAVPDVASADTGDTPPTEGCIEGDFVPYFGNIHAHTSYSDGEQTPADAFAHARDVANLDIQIITDHLEQIVLGDDWVNCRAQADTAMVADHFISDCGFEYGSGYHLLTSTGHNNVFFVDDLFPAIQLNFLDFFASLVACPTCVGQFNHPGDDDAESWNAFEHHPEVDAKLNLFEFNGGPQTWDLFFEALDAGWHISPTFNQDNHDSDWGSKNNHRSGFFLSELSRPALRTAMLQRRSFSTTDKNASLRLMGDTRCWMGSVLSGYNTLEITVTADDVDSADGYSIINLYGPGGTIIDSHTCQGTQQCVAGFSLDVQGPTYVVARGEQVDGDSVVGAPLWVSP